MTTKTINAWDWDLRVRDRNIKSGALTDGDIDKYLGQLPDLAAATESFETAQPALDEPEVDDDDLDEPASEPSMAAVEPQA